MENCKRINRIYSEAYEALKHGEIEKRDFYIHPGRSMLTSALGVFPIPSADTMLFGQLKEKRYFHINNRWSLSLLKPRYSYLNTR